LDIIIGYNRTGAGDKIFRSIAITTPVELSSFSSTVNGNNVNLSWSTATELNNRGFELERRSSDGDFNKIAFIKGNGTTIQTNNYSYSDKNLPNGKYSYRLKQIDFNGESTVSETTEAEISFADMFYLDQNYPNPFNPVTTIKFNIPENSNVRIEIFNALGEKCSDLVNSYMTAGHHEVTFEPKNLSSGIYYYSIHSNTPDGMKRYNAVKKLILLK
jgi:Secretion system C-terminal sorting domain